VSVWKERVLVIGLLYRLQWECFPSKTQAIYELGIVEHEQHLKDDDICALWFHSIVVLLDKSVEKNS